MLSVCTLILDHFPNEFITGLSCNSYDTSDIFIGEKYKSTLLSTAISYTEGTYYNEDNDDDD